MANHTDEGEECDQMFGEFSCLNLSGLPLILCTILLALVGLILAIENIFHHLRKKAETSEFWREFWRAFESELTILGVVSFLLFVFAQGLAGAQSESLENLITLIEFIHIVLFVTMCHYLILIAMAGRKAKKYVSKMRHQQAQFEKLQEAALDADTVRFCEKVRECFCFSSKNLDDFIVGEEGEEEGSNNRRFSSMAEGNDCGNSYAQFALQIFELSAVLKSKEKQKTRRYFTGSLLRLRSSSKPGKRRKIDTFMVATQFLMGDAFLASQGLPPDLPFDHVEYISKCTTYMYTKLIHLGWRVWMVFIVTISISATISGLMHLINGNTRESTSEIFTSDPDDNLNFSYIFMILGGFIILALNYAFHYGDTTFMRLMKLSYHKQFGSGAGRAASTPASNDPSMNEPFLEEENSREAKTKSFWKGKSLIENCCPCISKLAKDPYRNAFILSAPDFTMRLYQVATLFLGLLISFYVTVFYFMDTDLILVVTLIPLLITLRRFGWQSPKFACLRYFGPLAPREILDPLVEDARRKYEQGVRRISISNGDQKIIKRMYEMVIDES